MQWTWRVRFDRRNGPQRLISLTFFLFIAVLVGLWPASGRSLQTSSKPVVLLISLDGFRWDYLNRGVSPNINALAARGVRAKSLISVFPSETFPNHYSIVTGVYPEKHGIVRNNMYDPAFNSSFSPPIAYDSRWWGAEPIWITAVKQGLTSAIYFWPGSEAEVEGARPTYWRQFDSSIGNAARVQQVLSWLAMPPDRRPSFVAVYFSDTDDAGHQYGPDSLEVKIAIKRVDDAVGNLVEQIDKGLKNQVDIIVVSDHGMALSIPRRRINLSDYIDLSLIAQEHSQGGAIALVWPIQGKNRKCTRPCAMPAT